MEQRIKLLDSLRGFALFGILIANLLIFQYGSIGKDFLDNLSLVDTIGYYFTKIFFETSFMPIFTFLFGYSLIKFVESVKTRQAKTRWVLVRRAIGLLVLGLIHSTFIWEGDILFFYGQMSFLMLVFIYRKPITLFVWAGLIFILIGLFTYGPELELYSPSKVETYLQQEASVLGNGTYEEILDFRQNSEVPYNEDEFSLDLIIIGVLLLSPILHLPMFLIGMASAKLKFFSSPEREHLTYKKLTIFLFVGIALKSIAQFESNFSDMFYILGGPLLSLGYIGAFALFYHSTINSKYKDAFAAVGRLSLSNYLLQSIIFTSIFYGYGLGLFGDLGITFAIFIAILVFLLQIVLSNLYLRYFSRGPIETVLRMWTNLSWFKKPE